MSFFRPGNLQSRSVDVVPGTDPMDDGGGPIGNGEKKKMAKNILTNVLQRRVKTEKEKEKEREKVSNFSDLQNFRIGKIGCNIESPKAIPSEPQPNRGPHPRLPPRLPPKPPIRSPKIQTQKTWSSTSSESHLDTGSSSVVHSRTSSQSSGFEEGTSSHTGDGSQGEESTWMEADKRIVDLVSSYILPGGVDMVETVERGESNHAKNSNSSELGSSSFSSMISPLQGQGQENSLMMLSPDSVFNSEEMFDEDSVQGHAEDPVEIPKGFLNKETSMHGKELDSKVTAKPEVLPKPSLPSSPRSMEPATKDTVTRTAESRDLSTVDDEINDVTTSHSSFPVEDSDDVASVTSLDVIANTNMAAIIEEKRLDADAHDLDLTSDDGKLSKGLDDVTTNGLRLDYVMTGDTDDAKAVGKSLRSPGSSCSDVLRREIPLPVGDSPNSQISKTNLEPGGSGSKRKSVSFVAGDEDFRSYHRLRPPGIETQMVLPFTEQLRSHDNQKPEAGGFAGRGTPDKKGLLPNRPAIPAKTWKNQMERQRIDGNTTSTTKDFGDVTTSSSRLIRRQSDRINRPLPSNDEKRTVSWKRSVVNTGRSTPSIDGDDDPRSISGSGLNAPHPGAAKFVENSVTASAENHNILTGNHGPSSHSNHGNQTPFSHSNQGNQDPPSHSNQGNHGPSSHSNQVNEDPSNNQDSWGPSVRRSPVEPNGPRRRCDQSRYQSLSSLADVEAALDLAKKFEEFNNRFAAMATAASVAKQSQKEGENSGIKSRKIPDVSTEPQAKELKDRNWKTGKFPLVERLLSENWNQSDTAQSVRDSTFNPATDLSGEFWDNPDDEAGSVESGSQSQRTVPLDNDPDDTGSTFDQNNNSNNNLSRSSSSDLLSQELRFSSPGSQLQRSKQPNRVTSCSDLDNLESSGSISRPVTRSQSKRESGWYESSPRKSLQSQAAELQTQFSRWHRNLILEKSGSLFHQDVERVQEEDYRRENDFRNTSSTNRSLENVTTWNGLNNAPPFHRSYGEFEPESPPPGTTMSSDRPPGRHHRSMLSWDFESDLREDLEGSSGVVLRKRNPGSGLRRSVSCIQARGDFIPRTAMAKFNMDGTPRSILRKPSISRSNRSVRYIQRDTEDDNESAGRDLDSDDDDSLPPPPSPPPSSPPPPSSSPPPPPPEFLLPSPLDESPLPSPSRSASSRWLTPPSTSSPRSSSPVSPPSPRRSNSPSSGRGTADWGSSKFTALQNLHRRTALMKRRSQSDLGSPESILDALRQGQ